MTLWRARGWLDLGFGGVGMGRGRRDPENCGLTDLIDGSTVEAYEPDRRLRLRADLKLTGRGWLEFQVTRSTTAGDCSSARRRRSTSRHHARTERLVPGRSLARRAISCKRPLTFTRAREEGLTSTARPSRCGCSNSSGGRNSRIPIDAPRAHRDVWRPSPPRAERFRDRKCTTKQSRPPPNLGV